MDQGQADKRLGEASELVARLSAEHRMLVVLKRELYEGSWDAMLRDLRARLDGKPYIFKLVNRIEDDIERIEQLQAVERDHELDLADYISLDSLPAR